jgi:hypothetical protein
LWKGIVGFFAHLSLVSLLKLPTVTISTTCGVSLQSSCCSQVPKMWPTCKLPDRQVLGHAFRGKKFKYHTYVSISFFPKAPATLHVLHVKYAKKKKKT